MFLEPWSAFDACWAEMLVKPQRRLTGCSDAHPCQAPLPQALYLTLQFFMQAAAHHIPTVGSGLTG